MKPQDKLDFALIDLLKNNHVIKKDLISHFTFKLSNETKTASLGWNKDTNQFIVLVNSDFIRPMDTPQVTAVLMHEVAHALLLHLSRTKPNKEKFNIAADLLINETVGGIKSQLYKLLPNMVWEENIRTKEPLGSKYTWTTELIYDLLPDDEKNLSCRNWDEHQETFTQEDLQQIEEVIKPIVDKLNESGNSNFSFLANLIPKNPNKRINQLLRTFSTTFLNKSTNKIGSWLRKNRRLPNLPIMGKVRKSLTPHIIIGIDLSGSMVSNLDIINRFLSSLSKLNATFDLSLGDYKEKMFIPYTSLKQNDFKVPRVDNVGGGTDLEFVAKRFEDGNYDGTILFTDGYLDFPKLPQGNTIVVLTKNTKSPFKKTVYIN